MPQIHFFPRFYKLIPSLSLVTAIALMVTALPTQSSAQGFPGVELTIPDETVPPGGMLQLKVQITEPRPILKGGQKAQYPAKLLGVAQGIELFSPSGDASGTAVMSQGAVQLSLSSSLIDMGQNVDYPILTMAMPVKTNAKPGQTGDLVLDPSVAQWLDPSGQDYPVLLKNGILTIGGTLSIANLVPGGGVVPAGTKIAITGIGFQPDSKVQVNEAILATQSYVSANEIDVTLTTDMNMTSRRIRITNPSTNEKATYYSYARTAPVGKSKHALVAATVPLFSQAAWTLAYFKPVLNGSQFTGLAIQNTSAVSAKIKLQLFSSGGMLLKTKNVKLMAYKRISRDLTEFFVGVLPSTGTSVKVTSNVPVQLLGLLGDDVMGTVDPIDASPSP